MNDKVIFPAFNNQRYYHTHYRFVEELAKAVGKRVTKKPGMDVDGRSFYIVYKDTEILIDYGDHKAVSPRQKEFPVSFRFHYSQDCHGDMTNCFPLTPISFYDWKNYFRLEKMIIYRASGTRIMANQIPGKAAKFRRSYIQARLKDRYRGRVDTSITDQETFWLKLKTSLLAMCVPGARNDILDRGQFQLMAFGGCTVSPPLDIMLPYWKKPEPNIHYLACAEDYSDLYKVIDWAYENRENLVKIGQNAKKLFLETSTPEKVWAWIDQCLEGLK